MVKGRVGQEQPILSRVELGMDAFQRSPVLVGARLSGRAVGLLVTGDRNTLSNQGLT